MTDSELMQKISAAWGVAIAAAVKDTAVPAELLAALVANESGGNANAQRFEPATFAHLAEVLAGRRSSFSPPGISRPLTANDLLPFVANGVQARPPFVAFTQAMNRLAELATSYSLTQIMGWHWLEFSRQADGSPSGQLGFTVVLLLYFANKYTLDVTADFDPLLHCWNTGTPTAATFDPEYVPNGLRRLGLYKQIRAGQAGEETTT